MTAPDKDDNHLADAAERAARRDEMKVDDPEPSLARRFGQIGVLGWIIVVPVLLALWMGRWLDKVLATGITLTAALTMLGAGLGLWLALRWMHDQ
jgi:ATP synthase protein I